MVILAILLRFGGLRISIADNGILILGLQSNDLCAVLSGLYPNHSCVAR